MPHVFAYGSNLDFDQMKRRCPSARVVGVAALLGFRLAFAGRSARWRGAVATVIKSPDNLVAGVIYEVNFRDLLRLDGFEGAPRVYVRQPTFVRVLGTDLDVEVDTYVLDRRFGSPSREYVKTIARGFKRFGLDKKWLYNAVRFSRRRAARQVEIEERNAREYLAKLDANGWLASEPDRS